MQPKQLLGLVRAASLFDSVGCYDEADLVDLVIKEAAASYQNPYLMADSLARVLQHLMYRASPEKHIGYRQSLQKGLMRLNPLELAEKSPNNATAVGAAINIVKNVLLGQPPAVISEVVSRLQQAF